ncbi:hypothetical protein INT47_006354 [Mucor saturninus]|uniref:Mitochondrial import inner membrane translocase subunit TIM54 n=1 Tax=Mucor saturninus TaxID=64648 RepID=A0A8H7RHT7_9FUNG|nr:hypothetical protein INT47_006354 [Mucor saturninus]
MPFGLKVPSKNTLIFSGVAGGIAGLVYSSNKYAQDARTRLAQRISFFANRPFGKMPRKYTVYITAPPGDGLGKSRTWFREYVKAAILQPTDETFTEAAAAAVGNAESADHEQLENRSNTGFTSPVDKKKSEVVSDAILTVGRNAYREV